jgi:hypothetical protein
MLVEVLLKEELLPIKMRVDRQDFFKANYHNFRKKLK